MGQTEELVSCLPPGGVGRQKGPWQDCCAVPRPDLCGAGWEGRVVCFHGAADPVVCLQTGHPPELRGRSEAGLPHGFLGICSRSITVVDSSQNCDTCLACCSIQKPACLCHLPFLISPLAPYTRPVCPFPHLPSYYRPLPVCMRAVTAPTLQLKETGPGRLTCPSTHIGMDVGEAQKPAWEC